MSDCSVIKQTNNNFFNKKDNNNDNDIERKT